MKAHAGWIRDVVARFVLPVPFVAGIAALGQVESRAEDPLDLDELIAEGLGKAPRYWRPRPGLKAAGFRIPQAKSLPDPMFMFGYQNEGFRRINVGEQPNPNSMGMFSLSQQFYFPGKRALKGEMAAKDAESLAAMYDAGEAPGGLQDKDSFTTASSFHTRPSTSSKRTQTSMQGSRMRQPRATPQAWARRRRSSWRRRRNICSSKRKRCSGSGSKPFRACSMRRRKGSRRAPSADRSCPPPRPSA